MTVWSPYAPVAIVTEFTGGVLNNLIVRGNARKGQTIFAADKFLFSN